MDAKYFNLSYGLEGIDLLLLSILRDVENGFYIDVGANHPQLFSNTYAFYLKKWSGICIDGNKQFANDWKLFRPNDKFLIALLSDKVKNVEYTLYPDHTISTINEETRSRYNKRFNNSDLIQYSVQTDTLQNILNFFDVENEIHLLSIDIEGEELNALHGLDFDKNAPGVIVVEIKNLSLRKFFNNEILKTIGWRTLTKSLVYSNKLF
jgi:FkbM family methyltransferase